MGDQAEYYIKKYTISENEFNRWDIVVRYYSPTSALSALEYIIKTFDTELEAQGHLMLQRLTHA